jgi:hypothetical protein
MLIDWQAIRSELKEYRRAGGSITLDCHPGGCGRDGWVLAGLSCSSGVHVVACTGFHRQCYYSPGFWLWSAGAQQAARFFVKEIQEGVAGSRATRRPIQAGFIRPPRPGGWGVSHDQRPLPRRAGSRRGHRPDMTGPGGRDMVGRLSAPPVKTGGFLP